MLHPVGSIFEVNQAPLLALLMLAEAIWWLRAISCIPHSIKVGTPILPPRCFTDFFPNERGPRRNAARYQFSVAVKAPGWPHASA